jgi:hypothetical protein
MTFPIKNGNNNNVYVNTATTSFSRTDTRMGSNGTIAPRIKKLSFNQLVNDLSNHVEVARITVNVNVNAPFNTFGDELGHVYEALKNKEGFYAWQNLIEKSSNYNFREGGGHFFQNPGGIRANQFQNRVSLKIGEATIITPEEYDKF